MLTIQPSLVLTLAARHSLMTIEQRLRSLFETNDHLIMSQRKFSPPSPIRPLTGLSSEINSDSSWIQ
jgi:hypothetical protein